MQYVYIYTKYRYGEENSDNDDTKLKMEKYYVSLHSCLDKAISSTSSDLPDLKYQKDLKEFKFVWIDTWKQKRSFDKYHVFKITPGKNYELDFMNTDKESTTNDVNRLNDKKSIDDKKSINDEKSIDDKKNIDDTKTSIDTNTINTSDEGKLDDRFNIKYMLLHVNINKFVWRPTAVVKFKISFYENLDDALFIAYEKNQFDNDQKSKLKNFQTVWIKNSRFKEGTNELNGDHYQIIELKNDEQILLNSFCDKL
jgi:hypothetical protein